MSKARFYLISKFYGRLPVCLCLGLVVLLFSSCMVEFDTMAVEADDKLTIGVALNAKAPSTKKYLLPNKEWFEEICKSSGIEVESEIKGDTLIYIKLVIDDPESVEILMTNLQNEANRMGEKIQFHAGYERTDSSAVFRLRAQSGAFKREGLFAFISNGGRIRVSPKSNTDYLTANGFTSRKAAYTFTRPEKDWKADSIQSIEITWFDPEYKRKSGLKNLLAFLFEEHLWTTIGAVLGSIVSFVTILGYFKRKRK